MASIKIVVGAGFPGHATIQIDKDKTTTYLGLGPQTAGSIKDVASYDIVTVDKGVSPVAAVRNPFALEKGPINQGEYHYIDATHYKVKSFTHQISDAQADAAIEAAKKYEVKNPNYNGMLVLVCTDYALSILQAALPGSEVSHLSRVPTILQEQLAKIATKDRGQTMLSPRSYPSFRNSGLKGLQEDESPPNFSIRQQFNDAVPFNFASGEVGMSRQAPESKSRVSLRRAGDGSAELSVGDSTFVNFEPAQLASVANSDGKLRLSFSRQGKPDKFFGNVMAVDTGSGGVSVLDENGKLSNLQSGSRINVTADGLNDVSQVGPNDWERQDSEQSAARFG